MKGGNVLLWVVIAAIVWNAWLFHQAQMELEALAACLFALVSAWIVQRLPRWIQCPACGWMHPLGKDERDLRG